MFGASFLITLIVVILVKYGNKVQKDNKNLWPLRDTPSKVSIVVRPFASPAADTPYVPLRAVV
ncbi:hypothetical protein DVH05_007067 [Phytophthora capsici]|nr:hypothetical protein DVH05_007067 [Phytophthora capsici]